MKQYLIVPDIHVSFHDPKFISFTYRLLAHLKKSGNLKGLAQLGDALDFWQISSYPKDPSRKNTVKEDLDKYVVIMNKWASFLPKNGEFLQLEGNHEARLQRYISQNAKDIYELVTSIGDYLESRYTGQAKFSWHNYKQWDSCKIGDAILTHGFCYSKNTAMDNLAKYKTNLITGHNHRTQMVFDGSNFSATLGHGSDEKLTAHNPAPSGWAQSCGVLTVDSKGKSTLEIVIVTNGRGVYNGKSI